jgi:hypothetical protein
LTRENADCTLTLFQSEQCPTRREPHILQPHRLGSTRAPARHHVRIGPFSPRLPQTLPRKQHGVPRAQVRHSRSQHIRLAHRQSPLQCLPPEENERRPGIDIANARIRPSEDRLCRERDRSGDQHRANISASSMVRDAQSRALDALVYRRGVDSHARSVERA